MIRPLVLQFGATGQVAREAINRADAHGFSVRALARCAVDLTDAEAVTAAIQEAPAGTVGVFNAAAYTAVDAAEDDPETAFAVNANAPAAMALACAKRGFHFVHLSTDYVFDGSSRRAYCETDPVAPLGVYGRSKEAGERAVLEALPGACILRTAWVFSAHGKNFLRTILSLARERDKLSVVGDQRGCPTPASSIADAAFAILGRRLAGQSVPGGVFHFAGDEAVSWKGFADAILACAERHGMPVPEVVEITTQEFPTRARRPANSELDCSLIQHVFGISPADWRAALKRDTEVLFDTGLVGG